MNKWRTLDLIRLILCCIAIVILSYEILSDNIGGSFILCEIIRNAIWSIFFVLYLYEIIIYENRYSYIKDNIIYLIVLIPENILNKILLSSYFTRSLSIDKLSRLSKCIMLIVILVLLKSIVKKYINITLLGYAVSGTIVVILIGSMGFTVVEDNISFSNALWWSFVTATTVGYGDITPSTQVGRIIAALIMIGGVVFVSMLTAAIVSGFVSGRKRRYTETYRDKVIEDIKESIDNIDELTDDDIDRISKILKDLRHTRKR